MMNYIHPVWPAPKNVRAFTTTRASGNLADHVDDDPVIVAKNRARLIQELQLPSEPVWLQQTHSICTVVADSEANNANADASYTTKPNIVCAVLTADCLPLLICDRQGSCVAAVHAGWKGLASGVVESAVKALPVAADQLFIWLGPGIGAKVYEVGSDVREAFMAFMPEAEKAFAPYKSNKWLADMYLLARQRLQKLGVLPDAIFGGDYCTYSDSQNFYSYRRDGKTGRMANLIWLES